MLFQSIEVSRNEPVFCFDLPKVKAPFRVELTLRNTNVTIRSSYGNKKVSQLTASAKTGLIKGTSQPYHTIEVYDDKKMKLAGIMLSKDKQFQTKSLRVLQIGATITVYSKDPFGQKSAVSLKIKDDIAPKTPTISRVTSKATSVTGKTEAKTTVKVVK